VRSEGMFCKQSDYNLLFQQGLSMNWDEQSTVPKAEGQWMKAVALLGSLDLFDQEEPK
jgi:hypothetical protein